MHLMEIIDVMEEAVKAGKDVVRLQTGDFSIYGSIREQTEEMKKRGIEFDCIPGVSSFLGAASSIGTEYTVPEVSQSVIITRMAGRTQFLNENPSEAMLSTEPLWPFSYLYKAFEKSGC